MKSELSFKGLSLSPCLKKPVWIQNLRFNSWQIQPFLTNSRLEHPPHAINRKYKEKLRFIQHRIAAHEACATNPLLVAHAQLELLHPFHDGNGRTGRILIPLFLFQKKKLSQPMFYLSSYFESSREEYYLGLRNISQKGDWNGWIEFFLNAVTIQAKNNSLKVKSILDLHEEMKTRIHEIAHSSVYNSSAWCSIRQTYFRNYWVYQKIWN